MSTTSTRSRASEIPPAPRVRRPGLLLGGPALVLVFAVGVWSAWSFTIDDAFISFRYAANLADGHGPVWNLNGPPVEGFTNFAWVVWTALGAVLGASLPIFATVTSVLAGLVTLVLLAREAGRRGGVGSAVLAAGSYVLFLPTYFHIAGGLETAAFAAVLLRVVVIGLRVLDERPVAVWEPPALLVLLGMLRPEGVLAALPVVGLWIWRERRRPAARWSVAAAVVVGAAYFVWRWQFYGQLLPNTFYVKFGHLGAGLLWTERTTLLLLPLILLTLSLLAHRAQRARGLLIVGTVAATYVTYAVSGPSMDFLGRFADHAVPVLCLGAGLAVAPIRARAVRSGLVLVAVAWTAVAGATMPDLGPTVNYGPDLRRAHVAIGRGLAAAPVPAAARTLAVSDAGAIPYYSGWQSLDYIGLNDAAIARGADPTAVVAAAHPTVIIVSSSTPRSGTEMYGMRVDEVTAGYRQVAAVQMREGYFQNVYVRPEWAAAVEPAVQAEATRAAAENDPGRYANTVDRWLDRLRTGHPGG